MGQSQLHALLRGKRLCQLKQGVVSPLDVFCQLGGKGFAIFSLTQAPIFSLGLYTKNTSYHTSQELVSVKNSGDLHIYIAVGARIWAFLRWRIGNVCNYPPHRINPKPRTYPIAAFSVIAGVSSPSQTYTVYGLFTQEPPASPPILTSAESKDIGSEC